MLNLDSDLCRFSSITMTHVKRLIDDVNLLKLENNLLIQDNIAIKELITENPVTAT